MRISMRIRDGEQWAEVKERGYGHWVVRHGIVGFGIPLMVLTLVVLLVVSPEGPVRSWWVIAVAFVALAVVSGSATAHHLWRDAQKRFEPEGNKTRDDDR